MNLVLQRLKDNGNDTLGLLYVDNRLECFTLEDEWRLKKKPKETRIPAGIYDIELRTANSTLNRKYRERFEFHRGMLQLRNVPEFTDIYIHILNVESETDGCIGVGDVLENNESGYGSLGRSTVAYERLAKKVYAAMDAGELVKIAVQDEISMEIVIWKGDVT